MHDTCLQRRVQAGSKVCRVLRQVSLLQYHTIEGVNPAVQWSTCTARVFSCSAEVSIGKLRTHTDKKLTIRARHLHCLAQVPGSTARQLSLAVVLRLMSSRQCQMSAKLPQGSGQDTSDCSQRCRSEL